MIMLVTDLKFLYNIKNNNINEWNNLTNFKKTKKNNVCTYRSHWKIYSYWFNTNYNAKKRSNKGENIKSIPPSESNLLDKSFVTKSQQNLFSYFSHNTVVTRSKHIAKYTYAIHTVIPSKSREATDYPT